jgi:hypothetical protein
MAVPWMGSAQRGPCRVESWKPVWILSSKILAERVEEGRVVCTGVEVPLAVAGVEVPFVPWS